VKTITIRELRQRWPEAEKALEMEHELTITRDGKPVAKLVRLAQARPKRKRWDPQGHLQWLKKVWSNRMMASSDKSIAADRADAWEHLEA
jgi:antitoxin (DNA-binding transcriptional repressor) of toxin-antitoxin stability system